MFPHQCAETLAVVFVLVLVEWSHVVSGSSSSSGSSSGGSGDEGESVRSAAVAVAVAVAKGQGPRWRACGPSLRVDLWKEQTTNDKCARDAVVMPS